jgi:sulfur-carrier protein adenylyltransferase/sulfurtransferase
LTAGTLAQSIGGVRKTLRPFADARELTAAELAAYKSNFVAGWQIPGLVQDQALNLRVLLPNDSPFGRPRIATYPAPPLLLWPHLEEHGLLCILPSSATHQLENTGELAVTLLAEGRQLVNECLAGTNHEDFEIEFESYWSRWKRTKSRLISLCRHDGPTRDVFAWKSTQGVIVADTAEELNNWIRNRYAKSPNSLSINPAPLVRLDRPPRPDRYPSNLGDLLTLVGTESATSVSRHVLDNDSDVVVCVASTSRGQVTFGIRFDLSETTSRHGEQQLARGFRPGKMPVEIRMMRYRSLPVQGAVVDRVDASWIHGRDQNGVADRLRTLHVVLFGLGSLGSGIARLLALSGVGTLDLVDPELFESENLSRHELGAASTGLKKATAFAEVLRQRLPHIKVSGFDVDAHTFAKQHPENFKQAHLIISATGDWRAESWLNAAARELRKDLPTMFTWLEPHAAAAHAITINGDSPCLRCLFDETGNVRLRATKWNGRTTHDIPGCAGSFQPYGAVELSHCQSLSADLAIEILTAAETPPNHRVWLSRHKNLASAGGDWSDEWLRAFGTPNAGGQIVDLPFSISTSCAEHGPR